MMNKHPHSELASVVIAAAGFSSRFGECKFLMPYKDNSTVLEHIASVYDTDFIDRIVLVSRPEFAPQIERLNLPEKTTIWWNEEPERERFYTIQRGLKITSSSDFVFIQDADMPKIDIACISALYANRSRTAVTQPSYHGKNGHPLLIPGAVGQVLIGLDPAQSLKIALNPFDKITVPVSDPGVLLDIDTREEYLSLMAQT